MARRIEWHVDCWHDGDDYDAGKAPNERQVVRALSAAEAENIVSRAHMDWDVFEAFRPRTAPKY